MSEEEEEHEGRDLPVEVRSDEQERCGDTVQESGEDREAHKDVHVCRAGAERGRGAAVERNAAVQDDDRGEDHEDEVESEEIRKSETGPGLDRW